MKTFIHLSICILLLNIYSCSQEDDFPIQSEPSQLECLKQFARENGYTDMTVNISRLLTPEEMELCKSFVKKRANTRRGSVNNYMYVTEISGGYLQFDYSRDSDTKEIIEAYGGVYGSKNGWSTYPDRYSGLYTTLQTLYSRVEFKNSTRFDLIIKAYRLTSSAEGRYSSSMMYDHRYRLVIAAGLNVDTQVHNITIHEQGEGEWPLEP